MKKDYTTGERVSPELKSDFNNFMAKKFPKSKFKSSDVDFGMVDLGNNKSGKSGIRPEATIWNKDNSKDFFVLTKDGWTYQGHKDY